MTNQEAKFVLSAYRPSGRDTDNPPFADALRMASADPELGRWLERSRAYDSAVAGKLGEIAPPAALREAILAGARVSARRGNPVLRFSWVAGLAAAAVLTFAVVTMHGPARTDPSLSALVGFAVDDALTENHSTSGEPAQALKASLQAEGASMPRASQIDFERLRDTGCRSLSFGGHEIVEVCFARNGTMFHLYVSRRDSALADVTVRAPAFLEQAGAAAAAWSDGRYDFVLVSKAGVEAVRKLL